MENAYIEALQSNAQCEIVERYEFDSVYHVQMIFNRYYNWHNKNRKSPEKFLEQYHQLKLNRHEKLTEIA